MHRTVVNEHIAKLRRVFRERADHASFIGILTPNRIWHGKMQIRWRGYHAHESGVLATVAADDLTTVQELLDEIGKLKWRKKE